MLKKFIKRQAEKPKKKIKPHKGETNPLKKVLTAAGWKLLRLEA